MRRLISLAALAALLAGSVQAAGLPYWVCVDGKGQQRVQDQACADAPYAPPAGHVPMPGEPESGDEAATQADAELDTLAFWKHRGAQAWQWVLELRRDLRQSERFQAAIRSPWLWGGLAVLVLVFVLIRLLRVALDRFREWRFMRGERQRARSRPKAAVEPVVAADADRRPAPAPETARASAVQVAERSAADRFSPELLRKLSREQFNEFCLRLWRMQGLRAANDPGTRLSDHPVVLLQKPAAPKKPHGVALCIAAPKGALGAEVVDELLSLMKVRGCPYGAVMTPGEFTMEARDRVRGRSIELKGSITLMIEVEALADRQRRGLLDAVTAIAETQAAQAPPTPRVRIDPQL